VQPFAPTAAKHKSRFLDTEQDGNGFGIFDQLFRYHAFRYVDELSQNFRSVFGSRLFKNHGQIARSQPRLRFNRLVTVRPQVALGLDNYRNLFLRRLYTTTPILWRQKTDLGWTSVGMSHSAPSAHTHLDIVLTSDE